MFFYRDNKKSLNEKQGSIYLVLKHKTIFNDKARYFKRDKHFLFKSYTQKLMLGFIKI